MTRYFYLTLCILLLIRCGKQQNGNSSGWQLLLKQPGKEDILVTHLPDNLSQPFSVQKDLASLHIDFVLTPAKEYTIFKAMVTTSSDEKIPAYLALRRPYSLETPYNFNGEVKSREIYRQSPHDVNAWIVTTIAEQAVPVVALRLETGFEVALSSSPYLYDNFTSQAFYTDDKFIELSSGDNGASPGLKPDTAREIHLDYNAEKTQKFSPGKVLAHYHSITSDKPHVFEGLLFKSKRNTIQGLRKDINQHVATHFSKSKYNDYFGSLAFTSTYMNLRVNETGKSKVWIVPSVEYSNTQYGRDAFWMSMMLSPELSTSCLNSELAKVNQYAEYPLLTIIWAYRAWKNGNEIDVSKVQAYVDAVEKRVRNHYFYSFTEEDGRLDFQYWGDVMAFEKDDVVTYNQGLYALAMAAGKEMGLTMRSDPTKALKNYQSMYNEALGFFPISKKKNTILGPDPLIPDVLSQLYWHKPMLPRQTVQSHYNRMVKYSKTTYGFKIVSTPTGEYLPSDQYDIKGYVSQVNREKMPDGQYFRGGSFFLYDNLFLIDVYLHGIKEAEGQLIWRTGLDFSIGNTTYECLNTRTGVPWKPNMGWNVATYAIWKELIEKGIADDKLFNHINGIASGN